MRRYLVILVDLITESFEIYTESYNNRRFIKYIVCTKAIIYSR